MMTLTLIGILIAAATLTALMVIAALWHSRKERHRKRAIQKRLKALQSDFDAVAF